jgi:hypothetical protein
MAHESTLQVNGARVRLRLLCDEEGKIIRELAESPCVKLHFQWGDVDGDWCTLLTLEWSGEASWTAAFHTPWHIGEIAAPTLWRAHGWLIIGLWQEVYALTVRDGALAWKLSLDAPVHPGPVCALVVDEPADRIFVACELFVYAIGPDRRIIWQYGHPEPIVSMARAGASLQIEQYDGIRFWLDCSTGERVGSPGT